MVFPKCWHLAHKIAKFFHKGYNKLMKNRFWQKKKIIISLIIICFLVLLNSYQKEVKNFFYSFSSPFQKYFWEKGISASGFFSSIFLEKNNLEKENQELKKHIESLLAEKVQLLELKKENRALRKALDLGLEEDYKLVLAQIIGKDISGDYLIIDQGSEDGVLKDQPVITPERTLVGRVEKVYNNFSEVLLFTGKKSSFEGKIISKEGESKKEIFGLIKGQGKGKVVFDLIPKEQNIKKGDLAVSSGESGLFPPGILVGEIENIENPDVQPFQRAEIKPFFKPEKEIYLFVIIDFKQ